MSGARYFSVGLLAWAFCLSAFSLEKKNFDISEVKGDAVAHKIHGDGYKCESFEKLDADAQKNAVTQAKLASYAYGDGEVAYRDSSGNDVKRGDAYKGTQYTPLSKSETEAYLKNSDYGLGVDDSGTIYNKNQPERFGARMLKDADGNLVISYCGTEFAKEEARLKDVADDATQAAVPFFVPQQYKDAKNLLAAVLKSDEAAGKNIICDGHSLGGGLVAYAMAANDIGDRVTGYTYNTAGLAESTVESLTADGVRNAAGRITNFRNEKDPVSYVGYHLGPTYEVSVAAEGNEHTVKNDHGINALTENLSAAIDMNEKAKAETVKPTTETSQDSDVDVSEDTSMERLASQMLQEHLDGTSDVLPENLLNTMFETLPSDVASAQDIANKAFGQQIEAVVKDESLCTKICAFVEGKIKEGIEKGEEWVKNGGIRKKIQEELGDALTGKVSDADKDRILGLADALCNVGADGGKSFAAALGSDGKDLALSLAINEVKKQLSEVLPQDIADSVNSMLGVVADGGTSDDVKKQLLAEVQKIIAEKIPYGNAADTINGVLKDIVEGNPVDTLGTLKDIGKSVGLDALKDVIAKNLDPEAAAKLNALIDEYTRNGTQGLTEAALNELYSLIDKYAPGSSSALQLKGVVKGIVSGTVTAGDLKNTVTSLVTDGAKALIDKSDIPPEMAEIMKKGIDEAGKNGLGGLTQGVGDFLEDYVSDHLGDGAGDAVREIFDEIVTPGGDPWNEVVNQAPVIGAAVIQKVSAEVEKIAAAQIDKLIAKYPGVKNVLDKLGISGAGIVKGIKNVLGVLFNAPDLKTAITQLGQMAAAFLKNIAGKLIDWALEWALSLLNNLIPKVVDWASRTLGEWADGANNALVKKGLLMLQAQLEKLKEGALIKVNVDGTGAKVIQKLEEKARKRKKEQSQTILEGTTGN